MAQLKDLIVNGPSRFIGDVYATTFTGDLNGNANTATSATTAAALTGKTLVTASAVTTSNWPTYADNHIPTMSFMAYWNGAYSGTSSNLTYCAQGAIIGSNNIGNQSVKYATSSGSCSGNAATATKATQDGNGNVITSTYLPLNGGSISGHIIASSTNHYNLGSNTSEFKDTYSRTVNARHLDASAVYSGDHNLYIGYGEIVKTNKTFFYYSTESTRALVAEINSNGLYALTRFGVNGQSTSYNLYVNGSANATTLYENGVRVSIDGHNHDDRYYTESEMDTKLSTKSDTGHTHTKSQITDFAHTHTRSDITDFAHNHDDRYYTESEVNNLLANKSNTSHTHSYIVTQGDNRSVATKPNDYSNRITFAGLKNNSTIGSPSSTTYSYVVGLRGWSASSGGKSHELAFNDNGIFHRIGATDTWEAWDQLETKGNTTGYLNAISKSGNTLTITPKGGTAFTFTNTTYLRKWDDNASNTDYPGYGDATSTDDASLSLVNVGDMKRWNKTSYMLEGLETLLASI